MDRRGKIGAGISEVGYLLFMLHIFFAFFDGFRVQRIGEKDAVSFSDDTASAPGNRATILTIHEQRQVKLDEGFKSHVSRIFISSP